MKIAVLSDVHENFHNLILALEKCEELKVKKILFLWDFMNNAIAKIFASSPIPVFAIRWNNDGDKVAITRTSCTSKGNFDIWLDTFDRIEIDTRNIFLTHYPLLAKPIAKSWDFDAVFYGHNHIYNIDKIKKCIIVNPWEISAHKTGESTFALYDTTTNTAKILFLKNHISLKSDKMKAYLEKQGISLSTSKGHQY